MLLDTILQASIQGGLIILVLLICLKLLPTVHPKARVWLWRIVFLKFALFFLPFAAIPLKVLPQTVNALATDQFASTSFAVESTQTNTQKSNDSWAWAWGAGLAVSGIFALLRYRVYQSAVTNSQPTTDAALIKALQNLVHRAGIRRTPNLLISNEVPTAVVVGSSNPTILLPAELQKSDDLPLILAHEVAHVAHRDLEWNAFTACIESVFFFHPLVWIANRASHQAQEAAADAAAIRLTNASPKRYGEMLVRATLVNRTPSLSAGLSVGASTGRIRKRLQELTHVNKTQTVKRSIAGAVLICFAIAMTPAYQLQQRESGATDATIILTEKPPQTIVLTQARKAQSRTAKRATSKRHSTRASSKPRLVKVRTYSASGKSLGVSYIRVLPSVASVRGVSIAPTPARIESVSGVPISPTEVEPAGVIEVQGVPRAAVRPARGVTYTTSARAASIAPTVGVTAQSIGVAEIEPATVNTGATSISVSSRPAVAVGVSTVSSPRRATAVEVGQTDGVATSVSAASAAKVSVGTHVTTVTAVAVPARAQKVIIRKGTSKGTGKSKGSASSKGSGSGAGFGSSSGTGSNSGSGAGFGSSSGSGANAGAGFGTAK